MAEHKAEQSATGTTLFMERVKSIAAIVAALYFTLNTILSAFNVNPLPFTNEDVSAAVSSVGAVVMTIVVWWRQNVMTSAANDGHKLTTAIKTGQVAAVQGTDAPDTGITPATSETSEAGEVGDDDSEVERDIVTGTPVIHMGA